MGRIRSAIAPEIVACIAEGRAPTASELRRVADHIEHDVRSYAPAFAWGFPAEDSSVRLINMRAALVALAGSGTGSDT